MLQPTLANPTSTALFHLLKEFVDKTLLESGNLPKLPINDTLSDRISSPAIVEIESARDELVWQPAPQNNLNIFSGLEEGLGVQLHDDLKCFYGTYWSEGISCLSAQGPVQLIQVWNETDLEMLKQNLLGHAFMKSKKRQPLTFFLGVGQGEDMLIIENDTGHIYFEIAGRRPHLKLANRLSDYLENLEATLAPYGAEET